MSMDAIRDRYGVPAKRGARVNFEGKPMFILSADGHHLVRLVDRWPLVCIGSSGDYATLQTVKWHARMAEAMAVACDDDGRPNTRLHMLRGLALRSGPYPFCSADSTDIAQNHNRPHHTARQMADRIDGRQTPARWAGAPEQMELVA